MPDTRRNAAVEDALLRRDEVRNGRMDGDRNEFCESCLDSGVGERFKIL